MRDRHAAYAIANANGGSMKFLAILLALSFGLTAQAETLKDCTLYVRGQRVEKIDAFDIENYLSEEPVATIDGSLLDYSKTEKSVSMSFSNECDNSYEVTFSTVALAKAKSGEFKTIIGKAVIGTADFEKPFTGLLKCKVMN